MKRIKNYLTYTTLFVLLVAFSNPSSGQTVTYPSASGISLKIGSQVTIQWSGFVLPTNVKIELYKANVVHSTLFSSTANDGSEVWTVPSTLPVSSDYYIRISQDYLMN